MEFDIKKIETPTGQVKHQLRVWSYGPKRQEFKRRFDDKGELFIELQKLKDEEFTEVAQSVTFGELRADWDERKASGFSPGWRANLEGYWKELEPKLGTLDHSRITSDFKKSLEQELKASGNSQKTVNLKIGFIEAVLNFGVEMGKISPNPKGKFRKTKPPETAICFWEREDAEDFLGYAARKYPVESPNRWKYAVYLVGVNAALRAGEIWALKPRCLKKSLGVIYVEQQFDRVAKDFRPPKGKGPRNVPLNEAVAEELERLIDLRRIPRNGLIFPNAEGRPMDHDNFTDRTFRPEFRDPKETVTDASKVQWDGPQITFHGLRHTGATLMLESGVDVKTVQEILGHKHLSTTMRYVHLLSGKVKAASQAFSVRPGSSRQLKVVR